MSLMLPYNIPKNSGEGINIHGHLAEEAFKGLMASFCPLSLGFRYFHVATTSECWWEEISGQSSSSLPSAGWSPLPAREMKMKRTKKAVALYSHIFRPWQQQAVHPCRLLSAGKRMTQGMRAILFA